MHQNYFVVTTKFMFDNQLAVFGAWNAPYLSYFIAGMHSHAKHGDE